MAETAPTISPSELNRRVQAQLEGAPELQGVYLEAELSNFKRHQSGHWYFALRDAEAQLSGVMYRTNAARNSFQQFADGDRVRAYGSVTVWPARGSYQLTVLRMVPAGAGALWQQLARLKERLLAEGLFDPSRKRALPPFPRRVGVITSPTGAVIQDIRRTLARRGFPLQLILLPAAVQGADAVPSLLAALARAPQLQLDALILARGGGSIEDLWCFNDEQVVRAVAQAPMPVITAIGHETDTTLVDLVADLRASTPTAAAELIAPAADALRLALDLAADRLSQAMADSLDTAEAHLLDTRAQLSAAVQQGLASATHQQQLRSLRLSGAAQARLQAERATLAAHQARLSTLDPRATLARGYVLLRQGEAPVTAASQTRVGQQLTAVWHDGERPMRVEGTGEQRPLFEA